MASKVALVTGASRGAGRGIARGFGELGYTVYVTGRTIAPGDAKGWDGTVLPLDDPWWSSHSPQNGWGCKCKSR